MTDDGRAIQLTDPLADDELHLRDYWRVLDKHRRLIGALVGVCVLSTGVYSLLKTPRYTSTATIQIERQAPKVAPVEGIEQSETASLDKYDYYQTQFEILESRSIAARVIKELALDGDVRFLDPNAKGILERSRDWLKSLVRGNARKPDEYGIPSELIDHYLDGLAIWPVRNSRLVKVGFTSVSPDLAADVANRHIDEYVNATLDQRLAMTLKVKEFLEAEIGKSKQRVDFAEAALNKFRREKGIVSLDGSRSDIVSERLGDLNEEFTSAQAERIKLEAQYGLVKRRDYESLPEVISSSLINQLKEEAAKGEVERAELGKRYKSAHPKMKQALAREAQAKQRIQSEVAKIVGGVESSYLAAKAREEELGRQLETQRTRALEQKDVGADYDTLARDVKTARGLYANLLQRLKDVDVAEEIKISNVVVVDRGAVPADPSSPRILLNLSLAAALSLVGAAALAFLLEYFDNKVNTPEDVERELGLPSLGVIPSFGAHLLSDSAYGRERRKVPRLPSREESKPPGTELVTEYYSRSVISEAYRSVRTAILMSRSETPPQIILFTSGAAGEGKTVTAVNQAITLAQSGGRVLIVDADIRKPRVHRIFNLANGKGLSTYLAGQSELAAVIQSIEINGFTRSSDAEDGGLHGSLDVIPSGTMPPNPAELLGSKRMREMLGSLRERYDYIVIDTPPVLPVSDALLLSESCDGVVIVVRGQQTSLDVVQKSRDRLRNVRANILGIILNDVDVTSRDYQDYRDYYSYYAASGAEDA